MTCSLKSKEAMIRGSASIRPLFEGYLDALKLLERDYSIGGNVDPGQLLRMPGMLARESVPISDEQLAVIEVGVASAVAQALSDLETMRRAEGQVWGLKSGGAWTPYRRRSKRSRLSRKDCWSCIASV